MFKRLGIVTRILLLLSLGVGLVGCGSGAPESAVDVQTETIPPPPPPPPAEATGKSRGGMAGESPALKAVARKIIYTAEVSMVVEKLAPAQQKLMELVRKQGGYIAETNISGSSGEPRNGSWTIRVPVGGYQNFLDAVSKIGEVQTLTTDSSDVSEEYYDIEARLRNKRVEEKRLIDHLNRSTGKLSEILQVEKEISRVRGEIEQMQGRMRVLQNLTSLTTITVTIQEVKDYIPPAPPTFGTEIARSFSGSFGGLIDFGKGLVLLGVALLPWAVAGLVVTLPLWIALYRRRPGTGKK